MVGQLYGVMAEMLFTTVLHSLRLLAVHVVMKIGSPHSQSEEINCKRTQFGGKSIMRIPAIDVHRIR